MIRAVLDTNIYISAFGFGGKPRELIRRALVNRFKIVISELIITATIDISTRKIGLKRADVSHLMDKIVCFSDVIEPNSKLNITKNNADNIVLATALDGKADYLVTGDKKHLLPIKEFKGIKIVTAQEFLKLI